MSCVFFYIHIIKRKGKVIIMKGQNCEGYGSEGYEVVYCIHTLYCITYNILYSKLYIHHIYTVQYSILNLLILS